MKYMSFLMLLIILTTFSKAQNAEQIYPYLEKLCLDLHKFPELSLKEERTSERMSSELRNLGCDVAEKIGGYGVVGILKNGRGKTVLIRTDMDALPIEEKTGFEFSSSNKGVMHACGHDIHMSVFIGVAKLLSSYRDKWQGTVMMVAQPAEEIGRGSRMMLEAGLYERFGVPDYALAIHVATGVEAGNITYYPGNAMANASSVTIKVHGLGGHGALPQNTIDPILLSAQMITSFQSIVSREISPFEPAVVTVGYIKGGTKHNIIPNEVEMGLTIRSFNEEIHNRIIESLRNKSRNIALSAGLPESLLPEITISDETPSVYNHPELIRIIVPALKSRFGDGKVNESSRWMAAEDFANYGRTAEKVPSLLLWIGAESTEVMARIRKGEKTPVLHSADFIPDYERAIKTGVDALFSASLILFGNN